MSLTPFPLNPRPYRTEQIVEAHEEPVLSGAPVAQRVETVGGDHFVITPAYSGGHFDGWDAQRICVLHEWASSPLPAEDRGLCHFCPTCEWQRYLTGGDLDRGRQRFLKAYATVAAPVRL